MGEPRAWARRWRFLEWRGRPAFVAMQFQWEPRDLWVGIFWRLDQWAGVTGSDKHGCYRNPWSLHAYICVLPTLPLHVYVTRTVRRDV